MKNILITGGAGYIGSHTAYLMAQRGYNIIVLDALVHDQKFDHDWAKLYVGDIADRGLVDSILDKHSIDAVMHFAAFIEVGQSVKDPQRFYNNNVVKTLSLLDAMLAHKIQNFVFSSTCAVYGNPQFLPLTEDHPKNPVSAYGNNKLAVEMALADYARAYDFNYASLRYFNASGSLPEQGLGETHVPETHIIPLMFRAAHTGKPFYIFGDDYDTPDGTCIRDYVHVLDIADAHVKALQKLEQGACSFACNLGTGRGHSVKEMITACKEISGMELNTVVTPRREGDPAQLVADPAKVKGLLDWQPHHSDIHEILRSALAWEQRINFAQPTRSARPTSPHELV